MLEWRNRIVETRMVDAAQLQSHPLNPRRHPEKQKSAVEGLLEEVGIVDSLTAYHSETYGGLVVIDGHLRKDMGGLWPVNILDVTDAEAELILSTFDFTTGMATLDPAALADLMERVQLMPIENAGVLDLLSIIDAQYDEVETDEDGEAGGGEGGAEPSDGSLLKLANVTIAEPIHKVERGDVWSVGPHVLVCAEVIRGWPEWVRYLNGDDMLFAPYPGPFIPLTLKAESHTLLMVQPDPYIAGHILDRYADANGKTSVVRRD